MATILTSFDARAFLEATREREQERTSRGDKPARGFRAFWLLTAIGVAVLFIAFIKSETVIDFWSNPFVFSYTLFVTTFQLSRLYGAAIFPSVHKEIMRRGMEATPDRTYEPSVSIVVPCKNEEAAIGKTVDMCFAADYPKEKLEVIVINDGSTDGTGAVLAAKQLEYPNLIVIDWKINRGKRHGMAEGFRRARGEIVVQLDSDSYIVPETFRELIEPFRNPRIGAVCAHADPWNADANLMTRIQAAYYFVSFRVLKAAESSFLTVFCCSGCSSAYRRDLVIPLLPEWLEETFLGLPVTWGDDRALTNKVLALDYDTIYTNEARAYTIVPETLRQFMKQQVRWKKGWFVNSMNASKFIVRKRPFAAFTYFFPLIFLTLATPFVATKALVINPLFLDRSPLFYVTGIFLVSTIITLYYRYVDTDNKYWPYVYLWSGINMVLLSFVLFYSLATIQNRAWGTR